MRQEIIFMIPEPHADQPFNQSPEPGNEIARRTNDLAEQAAKNSVVAVKHISEAVEEVAEDVTDTTTEVTQGVTKAAKEIYQSASLKIEETLTASKEYVRSNPVPTVLCAIALGTAFGYLLMQGTKKPTFGEQYVEEPLTTMREAILAALTPAAQRIQQGYGTAMNGAENAMDQIREYRHDHGNDSLVKQMGRFTSNLRFW